MTKPKIMLYHLTSAKKSKTSGEPNSGKTTAKVGMKRATDGQHSKEILLFTLCPFPHPRNEGGQS